MQAPDGPLRELEGTGPLLGGLPGFPHGNAAVGLEPGSRLLIYTDGLTEAQDSREGCGAPR